MTSRTLLPAVRALMVLLGILIVGVLNGGPLWAQCITWTHLSSDNGDFAPPTVDGEQQTSTLIFDIDLDGVNDFLVTERRTTPSIVWYQRHSSGWDQYLIDNTLLDIEASGAFHDIDGDGDLDFAMGGDSSSNEMWWWENPYPNFDVATPWTRRIIKSQGSAQHHDMMFQDCDNDGVMEFIFWNQGDSNSLCVAEIPADPLAAGDWPYTCIFSAGSVKSEGLAFGDVDGDGQGDIVGGGYWFKHTGGTSYTANLVDITQAFSRAAVGQFIPGGHAEIVFVVGDSLISQGISGIGPLNMYNWDGSQWITTDILGFDVQNGHSLDVRDMDGDGNLDVFCAEMRLGGGNSDSKVWVLFGDGAGGFTTSEVATGFDNHESRVGDLDGDGDLDVLGKPFDFGVPGINIWLNNKFKTDAWQRHLIDGAMPDRSIFIKGGDINGDGLEDIIAGKWWWENPDSFTAAWTRHDVGAPMNNMAWVHDVDGDTDLDIIGTDGDFRGDGINWAQNDGLGNFVVRNIGSSGAGIDSFFQGAVGAELNPGGPYQIVWAWQNGAQGTQALTIPADPVNDPWPLDVLSLASQGEDLTPADIDGDGDLDLYQGTAWLRNDGATWTQFTVNPITTLGTPDRNSLVDIDGDGDLDAVVGFAHFQGGSTQLVWFERPADPTTTWTLHTIDPAVGGGWSLDAADLDADGDIDVVLGEHVGATRLLVYENNGDGSVWLTHVVDAGGAGIDHHDAAVLHDMDLDGDLDILSVGWDNLKIWVYENKSIDCNPDVQPPTDPTNLALQQISGTRNFLSWDEATDDTGLQGYRIERDGVEVGTSTNPWYVDSALATGIDYTYTVVAEDTSGNLSGPSNSVTGQTANVLLAPDPTLFAAYAFEEGSGTTITDETGNGNNGTLVPNAQRVTPGYFGEALEFDAMTGQVDLNNLEVVAGELTISFYCRPNAFDIADARLISKTTGGGSQDHHWMVSTWNGQQLRFRVHTTTGGATTLVAQDSGLSVGEWSHVAVTLGGGEMRIYQDGVLVGSKGKVGSLIPGAGIPAAIGDTPAGSKTFNGAIDEVRIFTRALSADELRYLSNFRVADLGLDTTAPTVPSNFVATAISPFDASLTWDAASDDREVAGYRLFRDGVFVTTLLPSELSYMDVGLDAGTSYSYLLLAFDDANNESAFAGPSVINTPIPDLTPPTTPAGVAAVAVSQSVINVTWNAATDNVGVAQYRVLRDGSEAGVTDAATLQFSDTGLAQDTTYAYTVVAIDAAGNESAASSPDAVATTPPQPAGLGLLAAYGFDEASGTTLIDGTGNGNDGILVPNALRDANGVFGGALVFDGASGQVDLGNLDVPSDQLTIACWIKPNAFGIADARIVSKASSTASSAHYWMISLLSDTQLRCRLKTVGGPTVTLIGSGPDLQIGQWTHVAMTYDGSTLLLYQDGVVIGSEAVTGDVAVDPAVPAAIGDNPNGGKSFDGVIDETWIYGVALSATEIADLMTQPVAGSGSDTQAPTAPTGVTAVALSGTQIQVDWLAATDNIAVTGYRVLRDGVIVAAFGPGVLQFVDTALVPLTTYTYEVVAFDAANNEATSLSASAQTPFEDVSPPTAPTGLTATPISETQVDLSWTAATDDVAVTLYRVLRDNIEIGSVAGGTTTFTDNGTLGGVTYSYVVTAEDGAGNMSTPSASVSATTPDETAPTQPTGLVAVAAPGGVDLSWNAATDNIGVTLYEVRRDGVAIMTLASSILSYTDLGVNSNTTYSYDVIAIDGAGNRSLPSLAADVVTSDVVPPTAPSGLTAVPLSETSVQLAWTGGTDDVAVVGYRVLRDGVLVFTTDSVTTSYVDMGLLAGTSYTYTILTEDGAGNTSAPSNAAVAATPDLTDPSTPTGVAALALSATEVQLTWIAAGDNVAVVEYRIRRDGVQVGTIGSPTTTFVDSTVEQLMTYSYDVIAVDGAGNTSAASTPPASVTTPDGDAPTTPANVQAVALSETEIQVTWNAATDNVAVTQYQVFRDGLLVATLGVVTEFVDTGLVASTTYSYTVTALDAETNESAPSVAAFATTDAPAFDPDLVAAYGFEGANVVVTDSGPLGNDGTLVPNAQRNGSGVFGQGITFVGAPGHVDLGTLDVVGGTGLTLAAWIRPNSFDIRDARIISKARGAGEQDHWWMLSTITGELPRFRLKTDAAGVTVTLIGSGPSIPTGAWTHIAATYDGSNMRLYQDGVLVGVAPHSGPVAVDATVAAFIGDNPSGNREFDGDVDEVVIYRRALTESEIGTLMTTPIVPAVDTTPPTVPTNVVATANSDTEVTVTWTVSTDDVGVTSYQVSRDGVLVGIVATPTFGDTGLTPNTLYSYTVRASDAAGNLSGASTPATVTTPIFDTEAPTAPTNVAAVALSGTEVQVTWDAATDNVAVAGYRVRRDGAVLSIVAAGQTSFNDTTTASNTTYSYDVIAFDAAGNDSIPSTASMVTTPDTTPPTIPTSLVGTALSSTEIGLTWVGSTDDTGVAGYRVRRGGVVIATVGAGVTSYSDTGLTSGVTYTYDVLAFDGAGNESVPSLSTSIMTFDTIAPTTPTGVTAVSQPGGVLVSWVAATDNVGVTAYEVRRDGVTIMTTGPGVTQYLDAAVASNTTYSYDVSASDAAGNSSAPSAAAVVTTDDVEPPTAPPSIAAVALDETQVEVTWGASTDDDSVAGYRVRRDGVVLATMGPATLTYIDMSAAAGTTYGYDVVAFDPADNESAPSATAVVTTPDTTPPTAPVVSGNGVSLTSIQVDWVPATDNVGVTSYVVRRDGVDVATLGVVTQYVDTGLLANTVYSYVVVAFDAAGNSTPSAPVNLMTLDQDVEPPTVPTNLTAIALSDTTVQVSWLASTDNTGVTGYRLFRDGVFLMTVNAPTTQYTDNGLMAQTMYAYTVRAFDAENNESANSNPVMVTTDPAPIDPALVASYAFDGFGTVVSDNSGRGNDGTLVPNAFREPAGYFGTGLETVGNTGYVDLGNLDFMGTGLTIAAWIKADDFGIADSRIISKATGVAEQDHWWMLSTFPGELLRFRLKTDTAGQTLTLISSGAPLVAGQWIHVAATYDGSTMRLYQDGVEVGSLAHSGAVAVDPTVGAAIGDNPTGNREFDGVIDEVWMYDRALSVTELATLILTPIDLGPDTSAPTTPFNTAATAVSGSSITISWNAASDDVAVRGYQIFRDGVLVAVADPAATNFVDENLAEGTTYSYAVIAYDAAGNLSSQSAPPAVATTPVTDNEAPTTPANVMAVALASGTEVQVDWDFATDNLGITSYQILRDGVVVGTIAGSLNTFLDTTAASNVTYSYTVVARDFAGNESAPSLPAVVMTPDVNPPTVPGNVAAVALSATSVEVSWMASADDTAVAQYRVLRDGVQVAVTGSAILTFVDNGVASGVTYGYEVVAIDSLGNESAPSPVVNVSTPDVVAPTAPTNVMAVALSGSQVQVTWTAATDNVAVTEYQVRRDGVLLATLSAGFTSYDDGAVVSLTTYVYEIVARDAAGNETASAGVSVTTPDGIPPTVPTNVAAVALSEAQVQVTWTAATDNNAVAGYRVRRDGVEVGTSAGTSFDDLSVSAATTYSYTVSAFDADGNESAASTAALVTTPDDTAPTQPVLTATALSNTEVDLQWTASTDNVGVTGYSVSRDGVPIVTLGVVVQFTDTGLSRNTSYDYEVTAFDAAGNMTSSTLVMVTTLDLDVDAPTVPTGVAATALSESSIRVTWTASTDDVAVTGYRLFRDGVQIALLGAVTQFDDAGLSPLTTYTYTLAAFDAAANESALSAPVMGTTDPPASDPTLVAAYGFEEGVGVAITDESGNGNDGTLVPSAVRNTTGLFFDSLSFDGNSGYVDLGTLDVPGSELTIMLYFNADDFGVADARLISKASGVATNDHYWMISTVGGDQLRFRLKTDTGVTETLVPATATISAGAWIHVAVTYDGATMRIFQDGVEVASGPHSGALATDPTVNARIGDNPVTSRPFSGRIDEVRIFNRSLDVAEINALMATPVGSPPVDEQAPSVPTGLAGTAVSPTRVDLDWNASTDNFGVTGYRVLRDGVEIATTAAGVTEYSDTTTSELATYNYEVSAFDAAMNESAAALVMVTTPEVDTTPPTTPTNVVATALSASTVDLTWDASFDANGVTEYRVLRDGVEVGVTALTQFTDLGLDPETTYSYEVVAYDGSGNFSPASTAVNVTTPVQVSDPSLIAAYGFEEPSGATAFDSSGNANDGTLSGVARVPGFFGQGIMTNGIAGRVDLGTLDIPLGTGMTIAMYFNILDFEVADARLISKASGTSAQNHYWMISTLSGNELRFRLKTSQGGTETLVTTGANLQTGVWTHVAVTYDGAEMRIYLDGVLLASTPKTGDVLLDPSVFAAIGDNPGGTKTFNGDLDEVWIYNRALTGAEITTLMSTNVGDPPPDELAPTVPMDVVGYGASTTRVDLHWSPSSDNVGVTEYGVFRDGVEIGTTTEATFIDEGLTANTAYAYSVEARDEAGNSSALSSPAVMVSTLATDNDEWLGAAWDYRVPVVIDPVGYRRCDRPAQTIIDFTSLFGALGETGSLDVDSVRLVEVNAAGQVIDAAVPYQFDPDSAFNAATNAVGELVWIVVGDTPATARRFYHVYFAVTGGSFSPPAVGSQVTLVDGVIDEFQDSYEITNALGTFYYQKDAGGFSSLLDLDGNDWISFQPGGGSSGEFRGIPNLVFPESYFHPGSTASTSNIVRQGPVLVEVRSITNDGLWECVWEIFPTFARMTVLRTDGNYWFLYEGTPGGTLDPASDFLVRADGTTNLTSDEWLGDIVGEEWAYFTDPVVGRGLFFANHNEDDTATDIYRPLDGVMTVFGFGRQSTTSLLSAVPAQFTIGFLEDTSYTAASKSVRSAYKDLSVGVGAPVAQGAVSALPTTPTGLLATALSDSVVSLTWNASDDNVGIAYYEVYRDGVLVGLATANSYDDSDLDQNTTYSYTTVAVDDQGNASGTSASADATTQEGLAIDVWYGDNQVFGNVGLPQPWINVLGNVSDPDGVVTLAYALNSGPERSLNMGPDARRLDNLGDFNIDLLATELVPGLNTIVIRAVDGVGNERTKTVTVDYQTASSWPLPYSIPTWSTVTDLQDVSQVVDGKWAVDGSNVRTTEVGYDRAIAIGETTWTDYEVTTRVLVHSVDFASAFTPESGGPGVGMIMRWPGHSVIPGAQPQWGFNPLGAIGWFRWGNSTNQWQIFGNGGANLADSGASPLQVGVEYFFKIQVETVGADDVYRFRYWEATQAEPGTWNLIGQQNNVDDPASGCVMLLAHHCDVSFGEVTIVPLP